jgi:hypothetical protein
MADGMAKEIILVTVSVSVGWILSTIFPKVANTIKLKIQKQMKKPKKTEKGTIILVPNPIAKSPKGYIFSLENPKVLCCGNCSDIPRKLNPLNRVGRKKYVCPTCKKEYKT